MSTLLILVIVVFFHSTAPVQAEKVRRFFTTNIEKKRFDTRKVGDRPIVLSIFFTNCIPCIKEIPQLYAFMSQEFPDVPLLFLDPLDEDSKEDIRRFSENLNVPARYFYKDNSGIVSKRFFNGGQFSFPSIIGLRKHNIIFRYSGINEQIINEIRRKIQKY